MANGWDTMESFFGPTAWRAPLAGNNAMMDLVQKVAAPAELHTIWDGVCGRISVPNGDGVSGGTCIPVISTIGCGNIRYAHKAGVNMLYFDGHTGWLKGPLLGNGVAGWAVGQYRQRGRMWQARP
jgi:prepilin-type processing-associated H-X9-DG protein